MTDAKEALRMAAQGVTAREDPVPGIMHRLARKRRRRRATSMVTALLVAGVGLVAAYTAFDGRRLEPASEPGDLARVTATIDVEGIPRDVAAGDGLVWVVSGLTAESDGKPVEASPGAEVVEVEGPPFHDAVLQAIDPTSDEVILRVSLRQELGRNVWPSIIAVGAGTVWVAESPGFWIHKVDPHTGRVIRSLEAAGRPSVLRVADGALWYVVDGDPRVDREPKWDGVLVKVNLQTLETEATIPIGSCCAGDLAEVGGYLWVGHQAVTDSEATLEVLQIDPKTAAVVDRVPLAQGEWNPGDTLLGDMAASPGAVWVTRPEAGFIDRIDATSARVSTRIPVNAFPLPDGASWYGGYVWVGSLEVGKLARIDPDSHQVTVEDLSLPTIHRRSTTDEALWIADTASGTVVRVEAESSLSNGVQVPKLGGSP